MDAACKPLECAEPIYNIPDSGCSNMEPCVVRLGLSDPCWDSAHLDMVKPQGFQQAQNDKSVEFKSGVW